MTPYRVLAGLRGAARWVALAVAVCSVTAGLLAAPDGGVAAQARLRLQPATVVIGVDSPVDASAGDRYIATEIEVLETDAVLERAVSDAGYATSAVSPRLDVEQVAGTDVVDVTLSVPAGYDPVLLLKAHLGVYFDQRRQAVDAVVAQQLRSLRVRVAELEQQLLNAPDPADRSATALRASLLDLQAQERQLLQTGAGLANVAQVIEQPQQVERAGLQAAVVAGVAGALLALMASAGVLLLIEWVRRPVRRLEDVQALDLPVFPYVVAGVRSPVSALSPAEAGAVLAAWEDPDGPPPRIVVTGADLRTDVSLGVHVAAALRERWPDTAYLEWIDDVPASEGELVAVGGRGRSAAVPTSTPVPAPLIGPVVVATEPPGRSPLCVESARTSSLTLLLASSGRTTTRDLQAAYATLRRARVLDVLVVLVD